MYIHDSTVKTLHPKKPGKCIQAALKNESPDFGRQSSLEELTISKLVCNNFPLMLLRAFSLPGDKRES